MRILAILLAAAALVLPGCEPPGFHWPQPDQYDYHEHLMVLHFRTINHALDTLGTTSVVLCSGNPTARRRTGEKPELGDVYFFGFDTMQMVYPDTWVHSCTTSIEHYIGYQLKYGGDTTRYGAMDRYGPWNLQFNFFRSTAYFTSGDSGWVEGGTVEMVPDTVRPNGTLELDIIMDLDGLLEWRSVRRRHTLAGDHIHITQR